MRLKENSGGPGPIKKSNIIGAQFSLSGSGLNNFASLILALEMNF